MVVLLYELKIVLISCLSLEAGPGITVGKSSGSVLDAGLPALFQILKLCFRLSSFLDLLGWRLVTIITVFGGLHVKYHCCWRNLPLLLPPSTP